jgi:hypothetical protein
MQINVSLMSDDGKTYGGVASLKEVETQQATKLPYEKEPTRDIPISLDLPVRPFMKRYGERMSGPKLFVLLLAHMRHGRSGVPVHVSEIQKLWNTMSGLIGKDFNSAYPTRAKDSGWVDTTKSGEYMLLPTWTGIL